MGKKGGSSWLTAVKRAFRSPTKEANNDNKPRNCRRKEDQNTQITTHSEDQDDDKKKEKRRWLFKKQGGALKTCSGNGNKAAEMMDEKHAIAVAVATAAAAEAAVATAQAAMEVAKLARQAPRYTYPREEHAAILIQTAFRGYLIDEGKEPTVSNLFLRLYQPKGGEWVDPKAKVSHENYMKKLSESQAMESDQTTGDGSSSSVPTVLSFGEQMKIWDEANKKSNRGRTCGFGEQGNAYSQSSTKTRGKAPQQNDTITTLVEENKRQKKNLDEMQTKLDVEKAKRKKQSKKYAKTTKDMQAQMSQVLLVLKNLAPSFSIPNLVQGSSNESEDGSESDDE